MGEQCFAQYRVCLRDYRECEAMTKLFGQSEDQKTRWFKVCESNAKKCMSFEVLEF